MPRGTYLALLLAIPAAVAHYNQAVALKTKGDATGAAREVRAALASDPAYAEAHGLLARILLEQNDPADAAGELRRAIAAKPSADLHFELGLAEGQLGKLPEAAAEIRRSARMNPHFARAYDRLGVALRRQDDRAGALAAFRQAVDADARGCGRALRPGGQGASRDRGTERRDHGLPEGDRDEAGF